MEDKLAVNRELRELKNEKLIQEKTLRAEQERFASMLKNGVGDDMHDVLSGKKKVKLSKWDSFKYKFNYYLTKILKAL